MVMDGNKYPSLLALGWTNPEALIMTSLIHFRCTRSLPFLSLSHSAIFPLVISWVSSEMNYFHSNLHLRVNFSQKPKLWYYALSHSVLSDSLRPHGLYPTRLLCPWDSPGKNTGVGCYFLLNGLFRTQGLSP